MAPLRPVYCCRATPHATATSSGLASSSLAWMAARYRRNAADALKLAGRAASSSDSGTLKSEGTYSLRFSPISVKKQIAG